VRSPPRFAEWLVERSLPGDVAGRSILGDLREEHALRSSLDVRAAAGWYRREAFSVVVRGLVRRGQAPQRHGSTIQRRGDPVWQDLLADAKHAARGLARAPRFTLISLFTLAIGIGTASTIFGVVKGVLLEPLGYPDPGSLVNVAGTAPGIGYDRFPLSPDLYFYYREHNTVFSEMALYQTSQASLTSDGREPERVTSALVSSTLLPMLGVQPAIGRVFRPDEDVPGAAAVAMLSHSLWQRRYGGDPGVIDRTLTVDGQPVVVVGVLPEDFAFLREPPERQDRGAADRGADLWMPGRLDAEAPIRGTFGYTAIARLLPGMTPAVAEARLAPLIPRMLEEGEDFPIYRAFFNNGNYAPVVSDMKADLVGSIERPLWILMGTVLVVLLIACANVANLFLIRAEGRQRDTAVQSALGASRGLLIRKHLVEAMMLALLGGAGGLLLAAAGTPILVRLAPPQIPRLSNVEISAAVVLFSTAASFVAAAFFGIVPALRHTRPAILATLRHGGRGATVGRSRHRVRGFLVVVQTAMALMLLVGSGLLVRSLQRVLAADPGFETENILTFRVSLPEAAYAERAAQAGFQLQLLERLAALPGVESAGAVSLLPLVGGAPGNAYMIEDRPTESGQLPPMLHSKLVTEGYMETLGLRLLEGRLPTRTDGESGNVVISRVVADRIWPGEEVLGRRLRAMNDTIGWYTVVGVVAPVMQLGFREPPQPIVYYSLTSPRAPHTPANLTFTLKTRTGTSLTPAVRRTVQELDPNLPIAAVQTMESISAASIVTLSFTVLTLGVAAGFALLLGAVGLYGVLAYAVSMRTREIGVRIALGAERSSVMRMVIGQGTRLAAIGLLFGTVGAAAATRLLRGVLFDIQPLDPLTFVLMSGVFLVVALFASWLPARRAASVDPLVSLQNE
jgi:putative ABC transport system permease protein